MRAGGPWQLTHDETGFFGGETGASNHDGEEKEWVVDNIKRVG